MDHLFLVQRENSLRNVFKLESSLFFILIAAIFKNPSVVIGDDMEQYFSESLYSIKVTAKYDI